MKWTRVLKAKKMKYWEAAEEVMRKIYKNLEKEGYENWLAEEWNEFRLENAKEDVILSVWFYNGDYYNGLENKVTFTLYVPNNDSYKKLNRPYVTTIDKAIYIENIANKIKAINFDYTDADENTEQILEKIFNMGDINVPYKDLNIKISPSQINYHKIEYDVDVYQHFPFFVNIINKDDKIYLQAGYINDDDENKIIMKNKYNENDINKMFDDIKQSFTKAIIKELKQAEREDYLDDYR